jgi:hypothetical protein
MADAPNRSVTPKCRRRWSCRKRIAQEFESVTDLGEHEIFSKYGDRVFRRLHLWACYMI